MKKIQFEAGDGTHFPGGVNYLISTDRTIYAECHVPDDCSEDYGYLTMKLAILAAYHGTEPLEFWYDDGQEQYLEPDAAADCEVYVDIKEGERVKVENAAGREIDFEAAVQMMDDEIRERLHAEGYETEQEFFSAYEAAHLAKFGEEWELSKANPVW